MKENDIALAKAVDIALANIGISQTKVGTFRNDSGKELTSQFMKFADFAKRDGFKVVAVKETYDNIYCTLNGFKVQFPKCTKDIKGFYGFAKSNYELNAELSKMEEKKNG